MNHRSTRFLLIVLAVACWTSPAMAIGTTPAWKPRRTVSTVALGTSHDGADRILAYDHWGNPGIVFTGSGGPYLLYARDMPGIGFLGNYVDAVNGGNYPSLAYDRYERPVISAVSPTGNPVRVYTLNVNDGSWSGMPVTTAAQGYAYSSVAIDSTGKSAVAYYNTSVGLQYIKDTDGDGAWNDETTMIVHGNSNAGYYASLIFDQLDQPMIAYQDRSTNDFSFARFEPGIGWYRTSVDEAGLNGYHTSLAIDPDTGYPAIAYFSDGTQNLRYAEWTGTSWLLSTIDSTGDVGRWPSLAFDPADGNPAISYYDLTNGDLKLAWFNGTSWQRQIVDSSGNVGAYTSLAFNDYGTGFPGIAYFNNTGTTLYYIEDPPLTVPEPQSILLAVACLLASSRPRRQRARAEIIQ